jgi:hypothetical protein
VGVADGSDAAGDGAGLGVGLGLGGEEGGDGGRLGGEWGEVAGRAPGAEDAPLHRISSGYTIGAKAAHGQEPIVMTRPTKIRRETAAPTRSAAMKPVLVKMPADLIELLDERARLEHRTRSNLIVHLLYTGTQQTPTA